MRIMHVNCYYPSSILIDRKNEHQEKLQIQERAQQNFVEAQDHETEEPQEDYRDKE